MALERKCMVTNQKPSIVVVVFCLVISMLELPAEFVVGLACQGGVNPAIQVVVERGAELTVAEEGRHQPDDDCPVVSMPVVE